MNLYTNWNLALCFAALLRRELLPYAFINSCAIFTSFHAALVIEPTAYADLLEWNGVTPSVFWAGDFVVHGLPLLLYFRLDDTMTYKHGLITAGVHLAWAYVFYGSIFLDNAYVRSTPSVWISLWLISLSTHLGVPNLFSWRPFGSIPYIPDLS